VRKNVLVNLEKLLKFKAEGNLFGQ
jgi:hypothetical protein